MPHMIFCMAVISLGSPEYGNIKELFFSFPFSEIRKKKILNQVEKLSFFYGIIELFLLTLFSSFFPQLFFLPLFPNKLKCFSNRVKKLHFCYPFSLFFLLSFLAPFTIFFFPFSSFFQYRLKSFPGFLRTIYTPGLHIRNKSVYPIPVELYYLNQTNPYQWKDLTKGDSHYSVIRLGLLSRSEHLFRFNSHLYWSTYMFI